MRFDLEIPVSNTDLTYISHGKKIPMSAIPLYYINIDHKDKLPEDFISVKQNVITKNSSNLIYGTVEGPSFLSEGSKFIITHVSKYNSEYNIRIPLFYKFIITENIEEDTIRIIDNFGNEISDQDFIVERGNGFTQIYLNKSDKILFAEYVSRDKIEKKMISYFEIFEEVGWNDLVIASDDIPRFKYIIDANGTCRTGYDGPLFIKYRHDFDFIAKPACNIKDNWHIRILGTSFARNGFEYSVPEFVVQNSTNFNNQKLIKDKKCRIITEKFIKLPEKPLMSAANNIKLFVYNFYTNEILKAYTTNPKLEGILFKDKIYYELAKDFNSEGIVELPIPLKDEEIVLSTFYIKEEYYEVRQLNLNSSKIDHGGYYAFYLKPNVQDLEFGVYFAKIGAKENSNIKWKQGRGFKTVEEYEAFCIENNCYNIGLVSLVISKEKELISEFDVRSVGGEIKNKKNASNISKDVFINDIKNRDIVLPTNDLTVISVNAEKLKEKNFTDFDESTNSLIINDKIIEYSKFLKSIVDKNMDASTRLVFEINENMP